MYIYIIYISDHIRNVHVVLYCIVDYCCSTLHVRIETNLKTVWPFWHGKTVVKRWWK